MSKRIIIIQFVLGSLMLLVFTGLLWEAHEVDKRQLLYSVGAVSQYTDSVDISTLYASNPADIVAAGRQYIDKSEYCNTWSKFVAPQTMDLIMSILPVAIMILVGILLLSILERRKVRSLQKNLRNYFENKQWDKKIDVQCSGGWQAVVSAAEKAFAQQQLQIEKLEQEKGYLKDFSQNIYHQVKSPIAAASVCLELELEKNDQNMSNLYRASRLLQKSNEMLTALLRVGQFDAHVLHMRFEPCYIDHIINTVCEQVSEETASGGNYDIIMDKEVSSQVGNTFWLTEAFLNLLRNAYEYSLQSEPVRLEIIRKAGVTKVIIQNRCPPGTTLPQADGRFKTTSQNHFGIGLHLANAIIKAHFGTLSFNLQEDLLTTVVLLPFLTGKDAYHA
jgi:signal transduction histidine kinase